MDAHRSVTTFHFPGSLRNLSLTPSQCFSPASICEPPTRTVSPSTTVCCPTSSARCSPAPELDQLREHALESRSHAPQPHEHALKLHANVVQLQAHVCQLHCPKPQQNRTNPRNRRRNLSFPAILPKFSLTWQITLLKSARSWLDPENAPSHKCGALTLLDPHKIDQRNLWQSSPTVREGSLPILIEEVSTWKTVTIATAKCFCA